MAKTTTDLWRSVRAERFPDGVMVVDHPAPGILYPDFEPREQTGGTIRKADVEVVGGYVQKRGGTPLFDDQQALRGGEWLTFRIPKDTVIDPLLVVRLANFNERLGADHYRIEVAKPIPVASYKGALDNLARAAVAKAYADARGL